MIEMIRLVIVVLLINKIYTQTNYCDTKLCNLGVQHIGCKNTGVSPKNCTDAKTLPMNQTYIADIIKSHNEYRSQLANGLIKGLEQAVRMPQIIWNTELAKLAELSVRTCQAGDRCRNTVKFKYVGQNTIVLQRFSYWMAKQLIAGNLQYSRIFTNWFDESETVKQIDLDVLKVRPGNLSVITHFTNMVNDKVTEMGCAALTYDFNYYTFNLVLVCNYNYANIIGYPVYTKGKKCSKCTKGCSKIYPGLCNAGEIVV